MSEQEIWTIKTALDWTVGYLERKEDPSPRLSAQWLLSEATGLTRIELYAHFDQPLSTEERAVLREFVARRGQGEPLQYITGEVAFRYINVQVRKGVLIPRPETEVLVSEALALLPAPIRPRVKEDIDQEAHLSVEAEEDACEKTQEKTDEVLLVADICTGSGCIACSIAHEHPQTHVIATDISPEALNLSRANVEALNLNDRIEVFEGDLGQAVPLQYSGQFDLVISNPPYIPTAVLRDIPQEVSHFEPELALDGGEDGLDIYRHLLSWCQVALKSGGGFAFELHEECMEQAADLARQAEFTEVRIVSDLAQRPRVITARKSL